MLRLSQRRLLSVSCVPTRTVTDTTGGVGREKLPEAAFSFRALLLPPQRRITRTPSGVRLATTWTLIPENIPAALEQDYIYFPGDARPYVITALKRYPRHLAYNLELVQ